ncbi:hypothetical protein BD414DRAFT_489417 [Trametes punicea]|nr:hypothetical protein BD414DRAFT_489417 [Trametes punicea]
MSTPPVSDNAPPRRPSLTSKRSNSVPFPSSNSEGLLKESESTSSALTSSDKLSALPSQSPPVFERLRTPSRPIKRSIDASGSFTSIDSPSGSLPALQSFHSISGATPTRLGESDSSVGHDTPRQRNESERSLPATLQSFKQVSPIFVATMGHGYLKEPWMPLRKTRAFSPLFHLPLVVRVP